MRILRLKTNSVCYDLARKAREFYDVVSIVVNLH